MSIHHSKRALLAGASAFERKSAGEQQTEGKTVLENIQRAFEELKSKNDERITEVKKGFDDVVRKDELKRINEALDKFEDLKKAYDADIAGLKRQVQTDDGAGEKRTPEQIEHKKRFIDWFRKGESREFTESDLRTLEQKALSVGSDPDGGYTVIPEIDQAIDATVKIVSPFRQYATVRQIGTASYRKMVNIHGTTSGWVGETDPRSTSSGTPQLKAVDIPVMEVWAMPAATQSMLDDSFMNVESWLADEVALEFAQQEGIQFISGSGLLKPRGILSQTIAADTANLAYGSVGYYATGTSGGFTPTTSGPIVQGYDCLINLTEGLKGAYRANAAFLLNRRTRAAVRQIKDLYANYIWQPGGAVGTPATILGYPDVDMEDMPDIAANSYSIAFGDWKRAYTIVDRVGIRVLRDPFTSKPNVLFYTTKRVGGNVTMHEAYKLLKFAAS